MNTTLTVVEVAAVEAPCLLEIDEYVPLRLRTYERPIGAMYVRMGNYSTTLLELALDPNNKVLRGVTITSYDALSTWPEVVVVSNCEGLPAFAIVGDQANRLDLENDFRVAVKQGEILVFWGELKRCDECSFERVHCLMHDGQLRGIRFSGWSDAEIALFATHAQQQQRAD